MEPAPSGRLRRPPGANRSGFPSLASLGASQGSRESQTHLHQGDTVGADGDRPSFPPTSAAPPGGLCCRGKPTERGWHMFGATKIIGLDHVHYYEREVARDHHDYLAGEGEEPGRWLGEGAKGLGLIGEDVDADSYVALMLGRDPHTNQPLRSGAAANNAKVLGVDLTFSAPKSVSLLWALSDAETSETVKAAHNAAVNAAVSWLERNALSTRRGRGGTERGVMVEGLTVAAFNHRTSRGGDPELHTHAVASALVRTLDDGVWRSLDLAPVYSHGKTIGMLYQAVLRAELTRTLGVEWEPVSENGQADLAAINVEHREAFSKRRAEIVAEMDKQGMTSSASAQAAALHTRAAKVYEEEWTLHGRWQAEAQSIGLDPGVALRGAPRDWRHDMPSPNVIEAALAGMTGVTERASTFSRDDVLRAVARAAPSGADITTIEAIADRFLASALVVEIDPTDKLTSGDVIRTRSGRIIAADANHRRWTTRGLLAVEHTAVQRATGSQRSRRGMVNGRTVDAVITHYQSDVEKPLGDDQADMVRACCRSGDGVTLIIGPPGSGKTYAARAAVDAWQTAGFTVWGAALQATAAKGLGRAAGIDDARTIAGLLDRLDTGPNPLSTEHVIVIDEAATVGTRALTQVITAADEAGAKVVLIGDEAQLPAVEAAGLFRGLEERIGATHLTEVRRFRDEAQRAAAELMRRGALEPEGPERSALVRDSLAAYDAQGLVTKAHNATAQRRRMVRDWHEARAEVNRDAVMYATRHKDVLTLNDLARKELRKADELPELDELTTRTRLGEHRGPKIGLTRGDEVLFTRNEYRGGYLNADTGTVERINTNTRTITVRMTSGDHIGRLVTVPPDYHDYDAGGGWLRHSYARTVHANQGATIEQGHFLASDRVSTNAALVAVTRGRQSNRLYFTRPAYEETVRAMTRGAMKQLALDVGPVVERKASQERTADENSRRDRTPTDRADRTARNEALAKDLKAVQEQLTDEMTRYIQPPQQDRGGEREA